ncbi:MAG: M20/M25/M40 family metallo-hydrolase [Actinobacteria bacterium]|uniref:Unannotated protein n=1 Tax=freshwater metagenome TaxID=449393 RepID=A0A6J5ZQF9_9ZZZZ|nr:M20/M25/M40 family metallo-hydrolase [Actinomycetota bacterium]
MREASELECRRLNETFAALCAIPSVSRREGEVAAYVRSQLEQIGLVVEEDDAAERIGGQSGNLIARTAGRSSPTVLFCSHLDTVPHEGPVTPVLRDGVWASESDTILGADNKAAVAVMLELARRAKLEGSPVDLEFCFTVAEEVGLLGASALAADRLSASVGFVFDHATPIGGIITSSPTHIRWRANLRGKAAHAGISPEDGRNAIAAAAKAIAALDDGRIDDQTTANVARISGGVAGTNVVPEFCTVDGEVRSLREGAAERLVDEIAIVFQDAANDPSSQCDLDLTVERSFTGYELDGNEPSAAAARAALLSCGIEPVTVSSGGGSDANLFRERGLDCVNLANGTTHPHETNETVSSADLESMLNVSFALLEAIGQD